LKRIIASVFFISVMLSTLPAFADPSGNASSNAFNAQTVNECRAIMKDGVLSGDYTKDQLKLCVDMMKDAPCIFNMNP